MMIVTLDIFPSKDSVRETNGKFQLVEHPGFKWCIKLIDQLLH